jgi:hypothetical protein
MAFRHAPLGLRSIGEMLGVQYVLSGSVQTEHPRALFVAELADTRDGRIVWTERFHGDLIDVFAMQAELARKVVQSVAPVVRSIELRRARITSFAELDAYGITLRGVELMHRLSQDDFLAARQAFETAIARNPVSPAPHAWLAKWHVMRVALGASDDAAQDSAAATACAERALACDAEDALALAVDAHVSALARDHACVARARNRGGAVRGSRALAIATRSDDLLLQFARRHGQPDRRALRARHRAVDALVAREPSAHADVAHARRRARAYRPPR